MIQILVELYIPLIFSNIIHMFIVKKNRFSFLKHPIAKNRFGEYKTYRGFIVLIILTGLGQFILNKYLYGTFSLDSLLQGGVLGFVYALFELPNSFLKRKLKIPAGKSPGQYKLFFKILDKSDSTLGVALIFTLFKGLGVEQFFIIFALAFAIHMGLSYLLVVFKVKESL